MVSLLRVLLLNPFALKAFTLRIVIFAKAPKPGFAKTRLAPVLGEYGAARLARRMLDDTIAQCLDANLGKVELCVTPFDLVYWRDLGLDPRLDWSDQGDGDIGVRMGRACERVIAGGESILLVGTDCPGRDAAYLQNMARALAGVDAVIAPAADGGYPAIALHQYHPKIFEGIAWSTSSVVASTLERFKQLGWSVHDSPMLHDIDEPADLQHVPAAWLLDLNS